MRLSVMGCGYVGLVTGACLAEAGHQVICTDCNTARIKILQSGKLPFYEPHLDKIVAAQHRSGALAFTANAAEAIQAGKAIFICVGTPPAENGEADLSAIDSVARQIAIHADSSKLVIEKSTVPVQTGRQLKRTLTVYRRDRRAMFRVASNPEFLREGTITCTLKYSSVAPGANLRGAMRTKMSGYVIARSTIIGAIRLTFTTAGKEFFSMIPMEG